jgi:hypothetical protein
MTAKSLTGNSQLNLQPLEHMPNKTYHAGDLLIHQSTSKQVTVIACYDVSEKMSDSVHAPNRLVALSFGNNQRLSIFSPSHIDKYYRRVKANV